MKYREDDADHSVESWFVKVTDIDFNRCAFLALLNELFVLSIISNGIVILFANSDTEVGRHIVCG